MKGGCIKLIHNNTFRVGLLFNSVHNCHFLFIRSVSSSAWSKFKKFCRYANNKVTFRGCHNWACHNWALHDNSTHKFPKGQTGSLVVPLHYVQKHLEEGVGGRIWVSEIFKPLRSIVHKGYFILSKALGNIFSTDGYA